MIAQTCMIYTSYGMRLMVGTEYNIYSDEVFRVTLVGAATICFILASIRHKRVIASEGLLSPIALLLFLTVTRDS